MELIWAWSFVIPKSTSKSQTCCLIAFTFSLFNLKIKTIDVCVCIKSISVESHKFLGKKVSSHVIEALENVRLQTRQAFNQSRKRQESRVEGRGDQDRNRDRDQVCDARENKRKKMMTSKWRNKWRGWRRWTRHAVIPVPFWPRGYMLYVGPRWNFRIAFPWYSVSPHLLHPTRHKSILSIFIF